jgi:hypothetical protein
MANLTARGILEALRSFAIFVFCACAMAAACRASASAATEFCPANLNGIKTASPDTGDATVYHYTLQALARRVVEGTIIADTDAGWFTWLQQPVQLTRTTYLNESPSVKYWTHIAESPELTVVFPQSVGIRHAWVATARTRGDQLFNWDAHGDVTCEPLDFAPSKYRAATQTRTTAAGDETPAPAPPPANAVAATAPFQPTSCAKPFVSATVTDAVQPDFPPILVDQGFNSVAISEIAVAVDPRGKLVDAWVWASSGYPPIDEAALKAARRSKYTGATSYCLPVSGTYLFRADFEPR